MRWVQRATVSQQRLGVLLAVVAAAGKSTTIEWISRAASGLLSAAVAVPPEHADEVATYLERMSLWKRYRGKHRGGVPIVGQAVQAQDLWLADPDVPSASGAVTDAVTLEPPQFAVALKLVRDTNYSLTDRGTVLRLAAGDRLDAVQNARVRPNPMLVPLGLGLVAGYALLDADFDFVQSAWITVGDPSVAFTRADFGRQMADACRHLRMTRARQLGASRQEIGRLDQLSRSIDQARKAATWGGARPPEKTATIRLEPYVDAGLIRRTTRFDYEYALTDPQREFFRLVRDADRAETFLIEEYIGAYVRARSVDAKRVTGGEILSHLLSAYPALRSGMGYASVPELSLYAASLALQDGCYFEIADAFDALRQLHRDEPARLRLTVARGGQLNYVKFAARGKADA